MLAVVSPAKRLDFTAGKHGFALTEPELSARARELVRTARKLSRADLARLMGLSDKLADLNYERFRAFEMTGAPESARPAVFAFRGDTYLGLDADTLTPADLAFAQDHLVILSGLYGLLRPFDAIQPYRLEMGAKLLTKRGADLYAFWGNLITDRLNGRLGKETAKTVVNLASAEYFRAIRPGRLAGNVVTPVFKEIRGGEAKPLGFQAKRARGAMARFIVRNRAERPEDLKDFAEDGFRFAPRASDEARWEFHRHATARARAAE